MDGIVSALKQAGRTDVKTFSTNGSAPGILGVQSGAITSVVWQPSEDEGAALMEAILEYTEDPAAWEPKTIKIDGIVVDASNVDEFIAEHPNAVK